ncbi:uncharacterized protein YukE [Actinoplanes tereljensis]|uniref:Uncharacterized protein n=1 Tax=Paractinoplanes tereljensis TaxID=571912 RepID=A0A919NT59_9ACTN|nr:hypothetical protein [Actinoplanes tereljensis]GIF23489.1 hypothetical protein Ate02nite_62190 [Actinoplanes tereljensis]
MTEFYVDAQGLNGLYNQLVRASQDASDTVDYTKQHCALSITAEGYLMIMLGPHATAYANMVKAIRKLEELAQGTGTQINLAQRDYARTDASAAARLDAGYPGATDPGLFSHGRTDLWPQTSRAAFADVTEPTTALRSPEYATEVVMWSINPLADLISPSAWLRQVSIWLFSYDPFEAWAKQFSGDWDAYVHCAVAWQYIGAACENIGRNLIAGAGDVPAVWRGNAAEGEQEYQLNLGTAAIALKTACDQYNDLYNQAAEATKNLFEVVSGLMSQLIDVLIIVNVAGAVGTATIETGVGPVIGYSVAAFYIWQAYKLYEEISKFFGTADNVIKALAGTVESVQAKLAVDDLPDTKPYHHPAGY